MICQNCGAAMDILAISGRYVCPVCEPLPPLMPPAAQRPNLGPLPASDPAIEKLQARVAKLESAVADLKRAVLRREK